MGCSPWGGEEVDISSRDAGLLEPPERVHRGSFQGDQQSLFQEARDLLEPPQSRDSTGLEPKGSNDREMAGVEERRQEGWATCVGSLTKIHVKATLFTGRSGQGPRSRKPACEVPRLTTMPAVLCARSLQSGAPEDPSQAPTQSYDKERCLLPIRTGSPRSGGPGTSLRPKGTEQTSPGKEQAAGVWAQPPVLGLGVAPPGHCPW